MPKQIETVEIMGSDGKVYQRTPCEVYTRVMGYIRPVSAYGIGKKAEMYSRKYYLQEKFDKVDNSAFLARYAVAKTDDFINEN